MPICIETHKFQWLHHPGRVVLFGVLLLALGACATLPEEPPASEFVATVQTDDAEVPRWWYLRFRLRRGEQGGVDSSLDLLIADQLLAPVIADKEKDIQLWRFHRRWALDATGHQFSFVFFSPSLVAKAVTRQVEQNPLLEKLRADGHLVEFRMDQVGRGRATDPAATSDTSWPPEIQREWPKFIMGASHMWLGLIQSEAAKQADPNLYVQYRAVEAILDDLWFNEANHAFFHHLSALFGYKPVRVIRRDIMTF
jgi:hypothetical protein